MIDAKTGLILFAILVVAIVAANKTNDWLESMPKREKKPAEV